MAERETSEEAFAITLTYRNNHDGTKPRGAVVFDYADVQDLLKGIRAAYHYKYGETGGIRYAVVGERGSKRDRVHYHMMLFSQKPLASLGNWYDLSDYELHRPPLEANVHWSLWPHGYVYLQRPDEGGMAYAIGYIFKNDFNSLKSHERSRETKVETNGASIFRMSRYPPLGQPFLEQKLARLREAGAVPTKLEVTVPRCSGYFVPSGVLGDLWIDGIRAINEDVKAQTGRDAPQWSSLLFSVENKQSDKIYERLAYGEIQTAEEAAGEADRLFQQERRRKEREYRERKDAGRILKRCGGAFPCKECLTGISQESADRAYSEGRKGFEAYQEKSGGSFSDYLAHLKAHPRCNPSCLLRETARVRKAFAAQKARPSGRGQIK